MLEDRSGSRADCEGPEELIVERPQPGAATITWKFPWIQANQKKCVQSKYVEVGGKDCRLLVYPFGECWLHARQGCGSFWCSAPAAWQGCAVCSVITMMFSAVLRARRGALAGRGARNQGPLTCDPPALWFVGNQSGHWIRSMRGRRHVRAVRWCPCQCAALLEHCLLRNSLPKWCCSLREPLFASSIWSK